MSNFNILTNFASVIPTGISLKKINHFLRKTGEKDGIFKNSKSFKSELSQEAKRRLKQAIDIGGVPGEGIFKENTPLTVKRKGFNKPLFWFGSFRNGIKIIRTRGNNIFIGIPSGTLFKKGPSAGKRISKIAQILEVKRPLFRWTANSINKDIKFQEKLRKSLEKDLEKLLF